MKRPAPWRKILCSENSNQALKRALSYRPSDLSQTPLPVSIENLPKRAYYNASVVRRAMGVSINGLSETGWEAWSDCDELDQETTRSEKPRLAEKASSRHQPEKESEDNHKELQAQNMIRVIDDCSIQKETSLKVSTDNTEKKHQGNEPGKREKDCELRISTKSQPTTDEVKYATALKTWAKHSPHTPPPADALMHIVRGENLMTLMSIMVPSDSSEPLRAAIVSALTDSIPTTAAEHVQTHLIIPYLDELKASATREMLTAIVQFYTRHWRPTTLLYRHFSSDSQQLNSAVAEVLTRIVTGLTDDAVFEALGEVCNSQWSERTIPVVEALVARCKNSKRAAAVIVPALIRNVTSLEKSVRFGKLLFFMVKDVSEVRENYKQSMENVCGRCKAFLAKRALALLNHTSTS